MKQHVILYAVLAHCFVPLYTMEEFRIVSCAEPTLTWPETQYEPVGFQKKDADELSHNLKVFFKYIRTPHEHDLAQCIPYDPNLAILDFVSQNRPMITFAGEDIKVDKKEKDVVEDRVTRFYQPEQTIEEIALDRNSVNFTTWTYLLGVRQQLKHAVMLPCKGTSLCLQDTKANALLIGDEGGALLEIAQCTKVKEVYRAHSGPVNTVKMVNSQALLTRSSDKNECYLWNLKGEKRPRIKLAHANAKTVYLSYENGERDLNVTLSHAGTKSKFSTALDNDRQYTIPHFWLTGECYSCLSYPQALYVSGLYAIHKRFMHVDQAFLESYKKCPIINTFEKEVSGAFEQYLDEQQKELAAPVKV